MKKRKMALGYYILRSYRKETLQRHVEGTQFSFTIPRR